MYDVECPYCGKEQEICHDDGYGYDESEIYEQECDDCGRCYTYTTSIIIIQINPTIIRIFFYNNSPCSIDNMNDL